MFYDNKNERILLFGGASEGGANSYSDMWSYDYAVDTWVEVMTTGKPSGRLESSAVFDPDTGRSITYGEDATGVHMWVFNVVDDSWSMLTPPSLPSPPRASTPLVYDERYDRVLMFSGMSMEATADRFPEDTWAYDPALNLWEKMSPDETPEGHYGHSFVYDPANERALMMGGHWWASGDPNDDDFSVGIWSYDYGLDLWTLLDDTQTPTKRHYHSCAVDTDTGDFVVFGGGVLGQNILDDTWIWRDGGWIQVTSEPHPSARMLASMIYDPVNKVMLLFGGMDVRARDLNEVWAFDGEGHWTQFMGEATQPTGGSTEQNESKGITGYPVEAIILALFTFTGILWWRRMRLYDQY